MACPLLLRPAAPRPAEPFTHNTNARLAAKRDGRVASRAARGDAGASGSSAGAAAVDRRLALAAFAAGAASLVDTPTFAVQGSIAGRVPGVSGPDSEGYFLYTRPAAKSGGHGVGWSEIPRYSFRIPAGWAETPVSIADLGGTEIDLRYGKDDAGGLEVVVAPVLRFADVGYNANVRIDELGPPDRIIQGFAPELYGAPLMEGDVLAAQTVVKDGVPYYQWELKPHRLVAATAVGNRVFILASSSNSRQWRKSEPQLRAIQESFRVPSL